MSYAPARRTRTATPELPHRSHAAIPIALVVVGLGLYLSRFSVVFPALFGVVLLASGGSLLSSRANPLSAQFYAPTKPSWLAVLVVFLGALALLAAAYALFRAHDAPVWPGW